MNKLMRNGTIIEASDAVISIYDHSFLYGIGLFETFRTYNGQPFLLTRHLERLYSGCKSLGLQLKLAETELQRWITELLAANELPDAYIRLTVSCGSGALGLPQADYDEPVVWLMMQSLPPYQRWDSGTIATRPLKLLHTKRNTPEGEVRFKSLHFMNNVLGKRELERYKQQQHIPAATAIEGLMLTQQGYIAEGLISNLFFIQDNTIKTPDITTGILPGITREKVLELAQQEGYAIEEGLYTWDDLVEADEVWITNSIQELVPVTQLIGESDEIIEMSQGSIGVVTRRLLQRYQQEAFGGKV